MSPAKKGVRARKAAGGKKKPRAKKAAAKRSAKPKRTRSKSSVKRSGARARREAASRTRPAKPRRTRAAKSRASRKRTGGARGATHGGAAPGKVSHERQPAKPSLRLVRRAARRAARHTRPAPPPAFPQTAVASPKQRLLFELVRARTAITGAIQGMLAHSAERPMGEGKWSTRETVLHLTARDRIRLRELEAVLRGAAPSWRGMDEREQNRDNERDLTALRHLPWDEAVRLLHATRRELMESIESVPDEPAEVWNEDHPFGWMMLRLPPHDRHHADAIKRWRAEAGE